MAPQLRVSLPFADAYSRTVRARVAEPKLLAGAGAGAGAGILKFRLRLPAPAPAPGQTKVVYLIIIHIE